MAGKLHHFVDEELLTRLDVGPAVRDKLEHGGYEPLEAVAALPDVVSEVAGLRHAVRRAHHGRIPHRAPDGRLINGWTLEAAEFPTVVSEEDSDTAFLTRRAVEFIDEAGEMPWMLHLSYFKPHWPNVAPAPYHEMYDPADMPPPVRDVAELDEAHPLLAPFREERRSLPFDEEKVWRQQRAT